MKARRTISWQSGGHLSHGGECCAPHRASKGVQKYKQKGHPLGNLGATWYREGSALLFLFVNRYAPLHKARIDECRDPFTWHDDLTETSKVKYNTLGSIAPSPILFLSITKLVLMVYTEFALRAFTRELNSNSLFHFLTISQYHQLTISSLHKSTFLSLFYCCFFFSSIILFGI